MDHPDPLVEEIRAEVLDVLKARSVRDEDSLVWNQIFILARDEGFLKSHPSPTTTRKLIEMLDGTNEPKEYTLHDLVRHLRYEGKNSTAVKLAQSLPSATSD